MVATLLQHGVGGPAHLGVAVETDRRLLRMGNAVGSGHLAEGSKPFKQRAKERGRRERKRDEESNSGRKGRRRGQSASKRRKQRKDEGRRRLRRTSVK